MFDIFCIVFDLGVSVDNHDILILNPKIMDDASSPVFKAVPIEYSFTPCLRKIISHGLVGRYCWYVGDHDDGLAILFDCFSQQKSYFSVFEVTVSGTHTNDW